MRRYRVPLLFSVWLLGALGCYFAWRLGPERSGSSSLSPSKAIAAAASVAVALLVAYAALSAGVTLLYAAGLTTRSLLLDACFGVGLGYAALAYLVFGAAAMGAVNRWTLWSGMVAVIALASPVAFGMLSGARRRWRELAPAPEAWDVALLVVLGAMAVVPMLKALSPAYGWDEQVYHLPIPAGYLAAGGLAGSPGGLYANMPHLIDLFFTLAMGLRGGAEQAAKLTHLAMTAWVGVTLFALGRRVFGLPRSGLWAALLFYSAPVVLEEAGMAYIDNGMALFGALLIGAVLMARSQGVGKWWLVAGVMAGALIGSKYMGGAGLIAAMAMAAVFVLDGRAREKRRQVILGASAMLAIACLMFLPWAIRQWLTTGNPVFPLLYSSLGGEGWNPRLDAWFYEWQRGIGPGRAVGDWMLLPWRLFMMSGYPVTADFETTGPWFLGALSPLPLMFAPLALWAWRRRRDELRGATAIGFAVWMIVWATGPQQSRFLIPGLPALCLFAAIGIEELREAGFRRVYGAAGAIAVAMSLWLALPDVMVNADNLKVVIGRESRDDFLRRRVGPYGCYEWLASNTDANERVLIMFSNWGYHCPRPHVADEAFEASRIVDRAERAGDAEALAAAIRDEWDCGVILVKLAILDYMRDYCERLRDVETDDQAAYRRGVEVIADLLNSPLVEHIHESGEHDLYALTPVTGQGLREPR